MLSVQPAPINYFLAVGSCLLAAHVVVVSFYNFFLVLIGAVKRLVTMQVVTCGKGDILVDRLGVMFTSSHFTHESQMNLVGHARNKVGGLLLKESRCQ